jgi:tRNA pseudouridine55 synthase
MRSGILLLDKPRGLSSNRALQRVRSRFERVKGGHVGSLDPLATGMLPVCLGEATKVAGDILSQRKCYRFTLALGARTDTGDAEGTLSERAPVPVLDAAQVTPLLARFVGAQLQVPPMYSALKRDGQPLYKLARAGVSVPRSPRAIEITRLTLVASSADSLELEVIASKGTYVRVLGEDIAKALGTLGHLASLRRLYVEPFDGEPMHTLESLEAHAAPPWHWLLPADWPLQTLPAVHLTPEESRRVAHGERVFPRAGVAAAERVRIYDEAENFLGLGAADPAGALQPRRLLLPETATDRREP